LLAQRLHRFSDALSTELSTKYLKSGKGLLKCLYFKSLCVRA